MGSNLSDLKLIIETVVRRAIEHRHAYRLNPYPGSAAASDLQGQPDNAVYQETMRTLYSVGLGRSIANEDLLTSAGTLMDEGVHAFASAVMARSSIEWSGLSAWVLDPSIDSNRRLARGMSDYIYGLWETENLSPSSKAKGHFRKRQDEEIDEAIFLGLPIHDHPRQKALRYVGNEKRPGTRQLFESMLGKQMGDFLFRFLSGMVHGTSYAIMGHFTREKQDVLGQPLAIKAVREEDVVLAIVPALLAYLKSFGGIVRLYGWDVGAWGELLTDIQPRLQVYIEPLKFPKESRRNTPQG